MEVIFSGLVTIAGFFLTKEWLIKTTSRSLLSLKFRKLKSANKFLRSKVHLSAPERLYGFIGREDSDGLQTEYTLSKITHKVVKPIFHFKTYEFSEMKIVPTSSTNYDFLICFNHAGTGRYLSYFILKINKHQNHPAMIVSQSPIEGRPLFMGSLSVEHERIIIHASDQTYAYAYHEDTFERDQKTPRKIKNDLLNFKRVHFEHNPRTGSFQAFFNNQRLKFIKKNDSFTSEDIPTKKNERIFVDRELVNPAALRFRYTDEYELEVVSGFNVIYFNKEGQSSFRVNVGYGAWYEINFSTQ